jgi:hypothetical protein
MMNRLRTVDLWINLLQPIKEVFYGRSDEFRMQKGYPW